ncbi:unnamed protein product [Rotaria socialis]|uniref:Uncharacterized protein n=1 Tax=Rotaria socialis TaxID=392032 RepID=A0A820V9G8_9BILA|nr:unnamed protein product [Rotaria socialis]CAF4263539.1 unnamed protein product [Rotaria socialis]CAF4496635.1 unnamed protein product [Rotaria socialis]
MITETRQSRTRLIHYEYHHKRNRRRHHTLDNATLDKFNFVCVPLNLDESRIDSSSSHTNLTMAQPKQFSTSITSILPPPTTVSTVTRRVRFKFDDNDKNQNLMDLNNNRHTRSSDDVRLSEKNSIHRVEFQIPVHKDINPWLNVDCSASSSCPAKTRSLTSQKIDIKHTPNNSMRVQGIAPFIEAEITSQTPTANDFEKSQSQWYRHMYGHLHKPFEMKREYHQNPYQPTYTFPEDFNGDLEVMEDYIRRKASQPVDQNDQNNSPSLIRTSNLSLKDQRTPSNRTNDHIEKVTRFEDFYSTPTASSSIEHPKLSNDGSTCISSSSMNNNNNNLRSNANNIPTSDNDQKLIYKRILRGGEIPTNGLQKFPNNNRGC